jgi:hypothetical protein
MLADALGARLRTIELGSGAAVASASTSARSLLWGCDARSRSRQYGIAAVPRQRAEGTRRSRVGLCPKKGGMIPFRVATVNRPVKTAIPA